VAEPDDLYVARLRHEFEAHVRVSGALDAYDYRYPDHVTGPGAVSYPPRPLVDDAEAGA
jgi:hypothetical protein